MQRIAPRLTGNEGHSSNPIRTGSADEVRNKTEGSPRNAAKMRGWGAFRARADQEYNNSYPIFRETAWIEHLRTGLGESAIFANRLFRALDRRKRPETRAYARPANRRIPDPCSPGRSTPYPR